MTFSTLWALVASMTGLSVPWPQRRRGPQTVTTGGHETGDAMPETISEQYFERSALSFLEANATPRVESRQSWGEGSDQVSVLPERTLEEELAELKEARAWAQTRFDA